LGTFLLSNTHPTPNLIILTHLVHSILFAFIIFNVVAALGVYWVVRVPKQKLGGKKKKE
jgi:ABC-type multidrug transport system permease subunit